MADGLRNDTLAKGMEDMAATATPRRTYAGGRTTSGWRMGSRITSLDQLKVGDILICDSHQFKATNLVRVDEFHNHGTSSAVLFHSSYVDPHGKRFGPEQFAYWPWEFDDSHTSPLYSIYRAVAVV